MQILGISCFYHDSAAALVRNGQIIAAAQEERFTRLKHDPSFPLNAIRYVLEEACTTGPELDLVVFYDKPLLKLERLLQTWTTYAPRGLRSYLEGISSWFGHNLRLGEIVRATIGYAGKMLFAEHHLSHAASAFYPSPFDEAAILTVDGVGEWATTTFGIGRERKIELRAEINFPHSLGLLYSAFTYFTGFKVNSDEYKLMGLAPYGRPIYVRHILDHLIDLKQDGSFHLNMHYFDYCWGSLMVGRPFEKLFGGPPRPPDSQITQREMDLAASIQEVITTAMLRIARHVRVETGLRHLTIAGGVALNCVANGRIAAERIFDEVWVQPAAGDAGGALGAALLGWYMYCDQPRGSVRPDQQHGSLLGPAFSEKQAEMVLRARGARYERVAFADLPARTAELLAAGKIVGWFQGRMEFGPRALGSRSILADPRLPGMQRHLNLRIKFRESFRPFAPAVLDERASEWFNLTQESPYMLLVADVRTDKRMAATNTDLAGLARLAEVQSSIPAVTHVDYSARLQTVRRDRFPLFHELLRQFEAMTGCPLLVNTSLNTRGEPIACTPQDAYRTFLRTDIDYLVLGPFIVSRPEYNDVTGGEHLDEVVFD